MMHEIDKDLQKCEASLYALQSSYPAIAKRYGDAKYAYEVKSAEYRDELVHQCLVTNDKPPAEWKCNDYATGKCKAELKELRDAEADMDIARKMIDTTQSILMSVQTRGKIAGIELQLSK